MKKRGETVAETDFVHKFSLSAKRKIPARAGRVSSVKFLIDCSGRKESLSCKFRLFSTWKLSVEYFCKQQTYSHKCQALITKPHIFGRIYCLLTYLRSSIAAPRAFINLSYSTPTVQGFIISFNLIALPHVSFEGQGMRVLPI